MCQHGLDCYFVLLYNYFFRMSYNPGWLQTHYIVDDDLELKILLCPPPPTRQTFVVAEFESRPLCTLGNTLPTTYISSPISVL